MGEKWSRSKQRKKETGAQSALFNCLDWRIVTSINYSGDHLPLKRATEQGALGQRDRCSDSEEKRVLKSNSFEMERETRLSIKGNEKEERLRMGGRMQVFF